MNFQKVKLVSATCGEEGLVKVVWKNQQTQERISQPNLDLFLTLTISTIQIQTTSDTKPEENSQSEANLLKIVWSDGHESEWNSYWLWQRGWCEKQQGIRFSKYEEEEFLEEKLWDAEEFIEKRGGLRRFEYKEFMEDSNTLEEFCKSLVQEGLVLLKNCSTETDRVKQVAKRISFLETTNYGKTFRVEAKPNPSNVAYSPLPLPAHTDLSYQKLTPGVQLLHCIKQSTEGGSNTFSDGFKVAEYMRQHHPQQFKILSSVLVDYWDLGSDYLDAHHYAQKKYCFEFDANLNKVIGVNFNHNTRNSMFDVAPEVQGEWYKSYLLFFKLMQSEKFQIRNRMENGDMVVFSNRRILHGREAFLSPNSTDSVIRILEGGYIRIEDVVSRYRVLRNARLAASFKTVFP